MRQVKLAIEGMSCGGCVRRVTAVLKAMPGVTVHEVAIGSASVEIDPGKSSVEAVVAKLNGEGFGAKAQG